MLPPGIPMVRSRSTGDEMSRHGSPSASRARQSRSGSARCFCRAVNAACAACARLAGRVRPEQLDRGVQSEQGECCTGMAVQDRWIGQRVAVDLARHHGRQTPGSCCRISCLEIPEAFLEVHGAGKGDVRGSSPDASLGNLSSNMLTLTWAPVGISGARPSHPSITAGATAASTWVAVTEGDLVAAQVCRSRSPRLRSPRHGEHRRRNGSRRRERNGSRGQCVGQRPHPADRYQPFAGPPADQVVQEAPVGQQVRIKQGGMRSDHAVGGHHSPDRVVAEAADDHLGDRLLDDVGPDLLPGGGDDRVANLGSATQRTESTPARQPVPWRASRHRSRANCDTPASDAGEITERLLGGSTGLSLDQQSARLTPPRRTGV